MKSNNPLNILAENVFWDEFNQREPEEERYLVISTATGNVLVQNARLTKDKKKVRV